jgi:hypothetical protein
MSTHCRCAVLQAPPQSALKKCEDPLTTIPTAFCLYNAAQHKQKDKVLEAYTSPTSSSQSPLQIAYLISSPIFSFIEACWCNREVSLHARKCFIEVVQGVWVVSAGFVW